MNREKKKIQLRRIKNSRYFGYSSGGGKRSIDPSLTFALGEVQGFAPDLV